MAENIFMAKYCDINVPDMGMFNLYHLNSKSMFLLLSYLILRCIAVAIAVWHSPCIYEPSRGKTNNVVYEQVRHKPTCTVTVKS